MKENVKDHKALGEYLSGEDKNCDAVSEETIREISAENEQLKKAINTLKTNSKIDSMLLRAGARNPIAARALLEYAQEEVIDFVGVQEQIDELKTSESYLFSRETKSRMCGEEYVDGVEGGDAFENGFKRL